MPCQALFCVYYRGVHLCEISIKPRLFMHVLLILKGVHEIAALSWFFCGMTKEQKPETNSNLSSPDYVRKHRAKKSLGHNFHPYLSEKAL